MFQTYSFFNRESENLKISKFGKDARRKMIEICLVKSAATSVVCWLVTKQIAKRYLGTGNFAWELWLQNLNLGELAS